MTTSLTIPKTMSVPGLFGVPNDIRVTEMPVPHAPPDGIVLKVECCGLCGSEVKAALQGHPWMDVKPLPLILGHEFAGHVIDVGEQILDIRIGDRLTLMSAIPCGYCYYCKRGKLNLCEHFYDSIFDVGGHAPFVVANGDSLKKRLYRIPDHLSSEAAALVEPLACALHGIDQARIHPGDSVVILGAGFMGLILANLAAFAGAGKVISVDQFPHRLRLAQSLGSTDIVNFTERDPIKAVRDLTSSRGADIVIEATGSPKAYEDAVEMVGVGGRVVFFGGTPSSSSIQLDPRKIHYSEIEIVGSVNPMPINVLRAVELLASQKVKIEHLITHRYLATNLKQAIEFATTKEPIKILLIHE